MNNMKLEPKVNVTDPATNPYDSWDDDEDEILPKKTIKGSSKPISNDTKDNESCDNKQNKATENSDVKVIPQHEDEGMIIKPSCMCACCTHWTESNDWTTTNSLEFEGYHKKTCIKEKKTQPFLRSEKHPGKKPKVSAFQMDNLTKVEKQSMFKTLVHGEIIPKPVTNFTDTYFTQEIQKALADLNYKYSLPLQSFACPAIFRQMNVFMIGGPKSGKTMAYLPAVATFGLGQEEKYQELAKHNGPLVIIICTESKQCEEVHDLLRKLHEKVPVRPRISLVTYPAQFPKGTDILITIPDSLLHCLHTRIFNLKRLCHLVLEDASNLLHYFENTIYQILGVVEDMLGNRVSRTKVQLIATSTKWSGQLEKLYKSIYVTPLICIEDYLEAALYGTISMDVKVLQAKDKQEYVERILQDKFNFYKTVVFCLDSEVTELSKYLRQKNIQTIALSDNSSKEEIEQGEFEWACTKSSQYKVLVCTDFVFETSLNINDANWLIHYSFSSTWTRFSKRFCALSSYYKSPWDQKKRATPCRSFLIIDDTCDEQMPKIINLMKRLNSNLPSSFKNLYEEYRIRSENEKLDNKVELCQKLKLFGKCPDTFCESRHVIKEVDVSTSLPNKGKVVFKILNMKDVTHYTVQLIAHKDTSGVILKINEDDLKKPLSYGSEAKKRAENIQVGKFYAHCDHTVEGDVYTLCHVLRINNSNVDVKLTTGLTLQTMTSKLFEVPSYLQIVDVFFCNLLPPFRDGNFSGRSFFVARTKLEQLEYKKMVLTGNILLQLDGTLWLDNVVEAVVVDGMNVIKLHLTKKLLDLQVVEKSATQINNLHKLCTKCDIPVPNYVRKIMRTAKVQDVEPQSAFLDDNINEVNLISAINPDEIYVRLTKFFPLLMNLETEIQSAVKTEIPDNIRSVEIGKYYLALDPIGQMYSRVKVLNVEKNNALCFYVDYGDEAVVNISALKILPSKYITKLPFQAIQCRLYGLCPAVDDKWDPQATDILYKYLLEPDSDIFRSLYIEVRAKDEGDLIRSKTKYSVLLKDGYGDKHVLINQILLECGLATSIFQKFDDFEIPQPETVENSSDFESSDENVNPECEETTDAEDEGIGEQFDCEIFDTGKLLEMIGMDHLNRLNVPQLTYESNKETNETVQNEAPQTSSEETSKYLTPEVYWSQTDDTVKMKIKLVGVTTYKTNLIQKRIFTFNTHVEDKNYQLKFTLHKAATIGRHRAHGQEVVIILKKVEHIEWQQLTGTNKRMRNIHYELNIPEDKRRRFLDLGITDSESDHEDNLMCHTISDMDSEFDEEAYSSSSD